ncbi:hypothetical protein NA57DRAFT_78147 [Rhizodiscina lignyota]|uniref:Uncharacterized protein n=1 Tax=Rhizodiscina lignyota TaxID=1504668 RepID=A0A9P4ICM2_9PEZI|nr:hypothetical protein NA57DRAFT_78147 [Rhizodiscina lignyota]
MPPTWGYPVPHHAVDIEARIAELSLLVTQHFQLTTARLERIEERLDDIDKSIQNVEGDTEQIRESVGLDLGESVDTIIANTEEIVKSVGDDLEEAVREVLTGVEDVKGELENMDAPEGVGEQIKALEHNQWARGINGLVNLKDREQVLTPLHDENNQEVRPFPRTVGKMLHMPGQELARCIRQIGGTPHSTMDKNRVKFMAMIGCRFKVPHATEV